MDVLRQAALRQAAICHGQDNAGPVPECPLPACGITMPATSFMDMAGQYGMWYAPQFYAPAARDYYATAVGYCYAPAAAGSYAHTAAGSYNACGAYGVYAVCDDFGAWPSSSGAWPSDFGPCHSDFGSCPTHPDRVPSWENEMVAAVAEQALPATTAATGLTSPPAKTLSGDPGTSQAFAGIRDPAVAMREEESLLETIVEEDDTATSWEDSMVFTVAEQALPAGWLERPVPAGIRAPAVTTWEGEQLKETSTAVNGGAAACEDGMAVSAEEDSQPNACPDRASMPPPLIGSGSFPSLSLGQARIPVVMWQGEEPDTGLSEVMESAVQDFLRRSYPDKEDRSALTDEH
jgi:hypothetical protein